MAQIVELVPDLMESAKSVTLTLAEGVGTVAIPDDCHIVGVKPTSSTAVRVGMIATEAAGTATGAAALTDLKKGCPVEAAVWTWFEIGRGTGRTLYVRGGTSDEVAVAVL